MKVIGNMFVFALGAAAGCGAMMGLDSLKSNKYQVKKTINSAIDNVASMK